MIRAARGVGEGPKIVIAGMVFLHDDYDMLDFVGIEGAWLRVAESPQGRHVQVANPFTPKRRAYLLSIKLRVVPRSWDGAHIHKPLHSLCFEQRDEIFLLPR